MTEQGDYNEDKVKKFHDYILNDYESSDKINEIANVKLVEKTDGSFTQIGIRPLLDDDIFISPSMNEYLPGAGRMVALGEMDFLIKNILHNKEIEKIKFKEDIQEFPKQVFSFDNAVILLSTKFYLEVFTKFGNRIDYEEKYPRLDKRYRIISIPEKVLGNRIIIIDKIAVLWEKQFFVDSATGKKVTLDISHRPAAGGKVDITIKSVNKIKSMNTESIKILEVHD